MGFLNPFFLLAAVAVAVPLILHLFHRHESRRIAFPALRYLKRTRQEHARTIRFRQLLLLLLRIATILLLVAAGARLFFPGTGGQHPPTALAIVLDNSMSSGAIDGENRYLDRLKALALESVERANPEDRIWVLRTGEPWDVAIPGGTEEARRKILDTGVSASASNVTRDLERAGSLVSGAELPHSEIHLLSDLQATGFPADERAQIPADVRVVVHQPSGSPPENRYLSGMEIGGGLTPLSNERTSVTARIEAEGRVTETQVRLVWSERVRGAAETAEDGFVLLPMGPFPEGWTSGFLEIDPDALRDDDRRYFAFRVRRAPRVAITGEETFFLSSAMSVLEEGGRAAASSADEADVLLSLAGIGIESRRNGTAAIIVPPLDETLLPALNRRLASAGIPWVYEVEEGEGEIRVQEQGLPHDLEPVRVYRHYRLRTAGTENPVAEIQASLATGLPWIVSGEAPDGPYLLFSSPLEPEATNLPVTAPMIPLMEWLLGQWAGPARIDTGLVSGEPIPLPPEATEVVGPDGTPYPVDGRQSFRRTQQVGIYDLFEGDSLLRQVAVNAPASESRLSRIDAGSLEDLVGDRIALARGAGAWERAILQGDEGAEVWRPLLVLALLFLVIESWIAASGRTARPQAAPRSGEAHLSRRPLKHTR